MSGTRRGGVLLGAVLIVGACGGGNTPVDAAIDAVPDAPPDALIDAPPPPGGTHRYVVSKQKVPSNNNEARMLAFDLNGDAAVDNQLGSVLGTLAGQGLPAQPATDKAVARGTVLMLGEVIADSLVNDPAATFTMYTGANPMPAACANAADTVCAHHLAGTATFELDPLSAHDTPLTGAIVNSTFTGGPGHLRVQLLLGEGLLKPDRVIDVNLIGARVKLEMLSDGSIGAGIIAGAIETAEVDAVIIPGIADMAATGVMADCTPLGQPPECGCVSGSTGATLLSLFDTSPKDCVVTVDEIRTNSLIQSLLAPDVTVEGKLALSVGFGITAVHGAFTP